MESALQLEAHDADDDLEHLIDDWSELAGRSSIGGIYASPQWILNYGRQRERAGTLHKILTVRNPEGRLVGVLPLACADSRGSRMLPILRAAQSAGEYESDWSIDPVQVQPVVGRMIEYLVDHPAWYQLELNVVDADSPVLSAVRNECRSRGLPCKLRPAWSIPYVDTSEAGLDPLELAGGKYRRELRRRWRKLNEAHTVVFEAADTGPGLDRALDAFFQVEASGWKGDRGSAIACQSDAERFWRGFARDAARNRNLQLHLLRADEQTISGQLGVTWGSRYYCFKVGYDPGFRAYGPGALMTWLVLQWCIEQPQVEVYDFAGPENEYMRNWTETARQTRRLTVGSPQWLRGGLFRAVRSAGRCYRWGSQAWTRLQRAASAAAPDARSS